MNYLRLSLPTEHLNWSFSEALHFSNMLATVEGTGSQKAKTTFFKSRQLFPFIQRVSYSSYQFIWKVALKLPSLNILR